MQRMWGWMVVLLLGYSVVLVLVYLFQERLVYFPEMGRELHVTPTAVGLAFEDVHLQTIDGETIHGWWVPVQEARGVVLILHGNAGNISHRLDYLTMFAALGYTSLIIDYRGYGRSTGSPSEEGTYRDAAAAWEYLTATRQVASHPIVLFGESLGGGVATWLAAHQPVGALVLASTFTSVPHLGAPVYWFLPVRLLARIHYDTVTHLQRVKAPVLIAHSPDDEVIPYAHGQALFAAAWPIEARRHHEGVTLWLAQQPRPVQRASLSPQRGQREKVRAYGVRTIQYGTEEIDMALVEQLVAASQTRYIADCLQYAYHHLADDRLTVGELVARLDAVARQQGLEALQPYLAGDRAWARPFEVAAALNRLRTLRIGGS